MDRLIKINERNDIPAKYIETPIGQLIEYHNLGKALDTFDSAQLLIGMCMDNRKSLRIPDNFAYIIRSGGGNLRYSEFKVSFAIAVGKVKHIALIGHNHCGMVNLSTKKETFIEGLIDDAGWKREAAEKHFLHYSPMFEIGDEIDFAASEAQRIRQQYPKIVVAPMIYLVEDNQLYFIKE